MPAGGSSPRLSRQTIIIAADLLKSLGHTGFDRLLLEYGISDLEAGRALGGLLNRANALANYAIINPTIKTAEGEPIAEAIVNRARQILDNVTPEEGIKFNAALARDGFANPVGGTMTYRITKPANLTPEQKRRAIPLLQRRVDGLRSFDAASVGAIDDPRVKVLSEAIDGSLVEVFGPESVDYERYKSAAELRPKGFFSAEPSIAGPEIERGKQQSIATLEGIIERFQEELAASQEPSEPATLAGRAKSRRVFIGHGRSLLWRELKDFIQDRLTLPWDEFNRVPIAGVANTARLSEFLDASAIAFILLTGEDELKDGTIQARMNTVHEAGLFQGKLGFTKAIILLEDGCDEFSNIQGLGQIRFPKGNIQAAFEEIRRVLERERILGVDAA